MCGLTEAESISTRPRHTCAHCAKGGQVKGATITILRAGQVRSMAFPSSPSTLVSRTLTLVKKYSLASRSASLKPNRRSHSRNCAPSNSDVAVAFAHKSIDLAHNDEDLDAFVTCKLLDDAVRLAVPTDHTGPVHNHQTRHEACGSSDAPDVATTLTLVRIARRLHPGRNFRERRLRHHNGV